MKTMMVAMVMVMTTMTMAMAGGLHRKHFRLLIGLNLPSAS